MQKLPALIDDIAGLDPTQAGKLRLAPEVRAHAAVLVDGEKQRQQRLWFQEEVAAGRRSMEVVGAKLYPYQVEGVMHLAFNGRALLADDMGLGKTVQAIGAAVLLKELRGISRVLVVSPASLKHQRRLRSEVLQDLPPRVDNNFFVPMTPGQLEPYRDYQSNVAQLLSISNCQPLTPAEKPLFSRALRE